jgi:hypothetical protein
VDEETEAQIGEPLGVGVGVGEAGDLFGLAEGGGLAGGGVIGASGLKREQKGQEKGGGGAEFHIRVARSNEFGRRR